MLWFWFGLAWFSGVLTGFGGFVLLILWENRRQERRFDAPAE